MDIYKNNLALPYIFAYMKGVVILFLILVFSCNSSKKQGNDLENLEKAKVIKTFKATSDMNDSYFSLKENNYFEFYKSLYDSVKNTVYGGKYSKIGDTLVLNFFDNKGDSLFGNRAVINSENSKIYFFNASKEAKQMNIFN